MRHHLSFICQLTPPYPIRMMYPDFESIHYETLAGMVIMQLADNHFPLLLDDAPDLIAYTRIENKAEPVLVITHVLPGSLAHQLNALLPGDRLIEVNEEKVKDLESFGKALRKSKATGYVALKTEREVFAVFKLDEVIKDEKQLSKDFVYPLSEQYWRLVDCK